jgi:hypothetical protein
MRDASMCSTIEGSTTKPANEQYIHGGETEVIANGSKLYDGIDTDITLAKGMAQVETNTLFYVFVICVWFTSHYLLRCTAVDRITMMTYCSWCVTPQVRCYTQQSIMQFVFTSHCT